jgi:hypothetical protein
MKKIKVPKFLYVLHGKETNIAELILIYGIAVITPVITYFSTRTTLPELPWWKTLLLFIILADLAGGLVANITYAATAFYEKKQWRKVVFIFLHIIHPAAIWFLTREYFPFLVFCAVVAVLFSFLTAFAFRQPRQQFAGFIGISLAVAFGFIMFTVSPYYRVASIFYMIKLIYSFSVDHYGCRGDKSA